MRDCRRSTISALVISPFPWFARPMELRIDVRLHPDDVDAELEKLYRRFRSPGDLLHGIAALPGPAPGLVLRHRDATASTTSMSRTWCTAAWRATPSSIGCSS